MRGPIKIRSGPCPVWLAGSIAVVALFFIVPTPLLAQQPAAGEEWVRKRVIPKTRDLPLQVGGEVVHSKGWPSTYFVQQADGPMLFVRGLVRSGWVSADQVVPYDKATEFFTDQIRTKPGDAHAHVMLGVIGMNDPDGLDKSLDHFNEAIRLDPESGPAYLERGHAWSAKGNLKKAIADFSDAIRVDPKFAVAHYSRGYAWFSAGEPDNAIADFSEAIRLDPKFAFSYGARGLAWSAKKEYDKAIEDCDAAIRLVPNNPLIYVQRGDAAVAKRDFDEAIADYSAAIKLVPSFGAAYRGRAVAWGLKKEWDKAIADYDDAIRLEPQNPASHNDRAWLLATCPDAKHRDSKRAVESATKACELSAWKNPGILDTLSAAYAEAGDFEAAVKWQTKAIEMLSDEKTRDDYRSRLELYRHKRAYHATEG
jgi:tetratricopeptide (TPR) repeat protein